MNGLIKNWKLLKHLTSKKEKDSILKIDSVIPDGNMRETIMHDNHESLLGGHRGETKTLTLIRRHFYWPTMKHDIKKICAIL